MGARQGYPGKDGARPMTLGGLGCLTARDGYALRYRRFRPVSEPRAVILGVHGIQSHAGWYDASCQYLASQGFDVFFVDRRGSGMNTEERGYCSGPGQLVDDLVCSVQHARELIPRRPVFLMAISWGGKLAAATLKQHPDLVDGLTLVCPGFFAKIGPTFRERMAIGGSFLLWPKRPIRVPLTDPWLFTDNPEWQEFLRQDVRLLRTGTARLMMTSLFLDGIVRSAPAQIHVPTLTMLAGLDRIIDNAKVRQYVDRFASADKQVIEYPSAHHTLEFEDDPTPIFRDMADWFGLRADGFESSSRRSG